MAELPKGVRNNNPGNLEYNPKWQGLKSVRTDDRFCEFVSMARGFRAMAVTLCTYKDKYDIDTITKAITRWAPPGENDTAAYIRDVSQQAKLGPDDVVNFHDFNDAAPIIYAIARHENGNYPFKREDLVQGCIQAGLENCPRGTLASVAKSVGTAGVAVSGYAADHTDWLASQFTIFKPLVDNWPHCLRYGFWVVAGLIVTVIVAGELRKYKSKQ